MPRDSAYVRSLRAVRFESRMTVVGLLGEEENGELVFNGEGVPVL